MGTIDTSATHQSGHSPVVYAQPTACVIMHVCVRVRVREHVCQWCVVCLADPPVVPDTDQERNG